MRISRAVIVAVAGFVFPLSAGAQSNDSLRVGDRIRVRSTTPRDWSNLFVGNVGALSSDTLTLTLGEGRGAVVLPRSAVAEIWISEGRPSRLSNLPLALPLIATTALVAAAPAPVGPHANASRNRRYLLTAAEGVLLYRVLSRTPVERWRPLLSGGDRR